MNKIVRKVLTEKKVCAKRKRELAELAAQPDSTIDLSEIPEATDEFWQRAVRNPFYRPVKKQITLRLGADVIAWLRKQGKGYQTRTNALLRNVMLKEIKGKAS